MSDQPTFKHFKTAFCAVLLLVLGARIAAAGSIASTVFTGNALIDVGQSQFLSASISGGTKPYTYNFLVYNTFGQVTNSFTTSNGKTQTFSFLQASQWGTGAFTANVFVTDSSVPAATVSNTLVYGVNSALALTGNTIVNAIVDVGQFETLTVSVTGGTAPYFYNYLVTNTNPSSGATNVIFSTILTNALATNTVSFTLVTEGNVIGVLSFYANAVDSASTNALTAVGTNTFTVNPALGVPTQTQYANSVSVGQGIAITASLPSGQTGTGGSYTYNWLVFNSTNAIVANALYTGKTTTSNIFLFNGNSSSVLQFFTVNVQISDAATSPASSNSINGHTIVVLPGAGGIIAGGGATGVLPVAPSATPTAATVATTTAQQTTITKTTVPTTTAPPTTVRAPVVKNVAPQLPPAPSTTSPPVSVIGGVVVSGAGIIMLRRRLTKGRHDKNGNSSSARVKGLLATCLAMLVAAALFFAYGYFLASAIVAFGIGIGTVYLLDTLLSEGSDKESEYARSRGAMRLVEELGVIEAIMLAAAIYFYFSGLVLQSTLLSFLFGVTFTTMVDKAKIRRERYVLGARGA